MSGGLSQAVGDKRPLWSEEGNDGDGDQCGISSPLPKDVKGLAVLLAAL